MSMQQEIDDYLAQRRAEGLMPATLQRDGEMLVRFHRFLKHRGCRRWADVMPGDLDAILADLAERGRARATLTGCASLLRCFGRWLQERGKVLLNPARDLPIPDDIIPELPKPPLEEAQVADILDKLPRRNVRDLRNRAMLEVMYGCGLRRNEVIMLDLPHLDFSRRTLLVVGGKGGKDRIMPLMSGALGALRDYLALRRTMLKGPDQGTVFLDHNGQRINQSSLKGSIRYLSKTKHPDKPRFHCHLFRHSIAVHLLRRGADIRHVQEFLGHARLDTTKVYLRMVPGHLKDDYDEAMPEIDVRV
jgi:site-specific recombinase XerD